MVACRKELHVVADACLVQLKVIVVPAWLNLHRHVLQAGIILVLLFTHLLKDLISPVSHDILFSLPDTFETAPAVLLDSNLDLIFLKHPRVIIVHVPCLDQTPDQWIEPHAVLLNEVLIKLIQWIA